MSHKRSERSAEFRRHVEQFDKSDVQFTARIITERIRRRRWGQRTWSGDVGLPPKPVIIGIEPMTIGAQPTEPRPTRRGAVAPSVALVNTRTPRVLPRRRWDWLRDLLAGFDSDRGLPVGFTLLALSMALWVWLANGEATNVLRYGFVALTLALLTPLLLIGASMVCLAGSLWMEVRQLWIDQHRWPMG